MPVAEPNYRYHGDVPSVALFAEAARQLNICNSCRYCEGYCAVYPALERRTELDSGDIAYLANLCHDCRACLVACMYAPPHEFGVNPPAILAQVREVTYQSNHLMSLPQLLKAPRFSPLTKFSLVALLGIAGVLILVTVDHGLSSLFHILDPIGSPYAFVSYELIVTVSLVIFGLSLFASLADVITYWGATRGLLRDLFRFEPWAKALRDGATLRYMRGGAEGCYSTSTRATSTRRILHYFVSYGFLLCLLATVSAAVEQDLQSINPPFDLISVPVICGVLGGVGLIVGSIGLLYGKRTQDATATYGPMTDLDRAFLIALLALGTTGLLTLIMRSRSLYGFVLAVHLGVVWASLLLAPYSKFVHFLYRLLALVQDNLEREDAMAGD